MENDNQKSNYILVIIAVLLLVISGFLVFWFSPKRSAKIAFSDKRAAESPKNINKAVLTIDFGNGKKRIFEGEIVGSERLTDALVLASRAGNFDYKLDKNKKVVSIDKFAVNDKNSWISEINGETVGQSLDRIFLKSNDKILFRYTPR